MSLLFYLANGPWHPGDGGETALYASSSDAALTGPAATVAPVDNSLVLFECTPYSWHTFLSNRVRPRESLVMWLHRSKQDTVDRWGEASIAYWHTIKEDTLEKWDHILQLYNQLLRLEYSPVAALNRTYALFKVYGADAAIREALSLELHGNHFYYVLLGELHLEKDTTVSRSYFEKALLLAKNATDRQTIQRKIDKL